MKTLFTLISLSSIALVSADYGRTYEYDVDVYPSYSDRGYSRGYYQDYYDERPRYEVRIEPQSYDGYSRDGRYYQSNAYRSDNYRDSYAGDRDGYYANRRDDKHVSDEEIRKNIHNALGSGWFSKGFEKVHFDVRNGYVVLSGSVDTLADKNKVEDRVRDIEGVKETDNRIAVMKEDRQNSNDYSEEDLRDSEKKYPQDRAATLRDRQINAKIRDKLGSGWFFKGYETLIIGTDNGVVVIRGTVDNMDDLQKIRDKVRDIEGVRSVNTQIGVKKNG